MLARPTNSVRTVPACAAWRPPLLPEAIWRARLEALLAQGTLLRSGAWLHLPGHLPTLDETQQALVRSVLPQLTAGHFDPPWVRDLAHAGAASEQGMRDALRALARQGEVYQVVRDLFYPRQTIAALAHIVATLADQHTDGVSASTFRDATQLGRKRAIQVLEFFDRVGYTRFHHDRHYCARRQPYPALGPPS